MQENFKKGFFLTKKRKRGTICVGRDEKEVIMKKKKTSSRVKRSVMPTPIKVGCKSKSIKAKGIAKSFVNVGIPVVLETQIGVNYRGISSQLIQSGNKPVRSFDRQLKIKL